MRQTYILFTILAALGLLLGGCGEKSPQDAVAPSQNSVASSDSSAVENTMAVKSIQQSILSAAGTPISYQSAGEFQAALSTPDWSILSGADTLSGSGLAAGAAASGAAPNRPADNLVLVVSDAETKADSNKSARKSASKMGLILMRKIVVPEYPSRKPVTDKRERPASSRETEQDGKRPNPSPMHLR